MLLAIDIGNTNTVFAVFKDEALVDSWRLHTLNARSADEYAGFLNQVFNLADLNLKDVETVLIGSVVPETNFHMRALCEKYIGIDPVFITKDNVGIDIDLDRPEDVGADRLVNALAVKVHYKSPAIVIDFGTATTFDVIYADGAYAGGVIAPGVDVSIDALLREASKLPKISVHKPQNVIGRSTVQAMRAGIYWGYASMIEGVVSQIKSEIGDDVLVLATGGLANVFAEELKDVIDTVDQDLTLKGLYEVHKGLSA